MKLSMIASRSVLTIGPHDSFDKAIDLMEEHDVHHLPVVDGGRLVGMLSDRDLLLAVGWRLESQRRVDGERRAVAGPHRVAEIMSHPVVHLAPTDDLHTAARTMIERHIHALPLVNQGALVGLVTKLDLLRWFFESDDGRNAAATLAARPITQVMQSRVFSIGPREPVHAAVRMMREKNVRHVPVVSEGLLVGIVSDRDVRRACGQESIADAQAQASGRMYLGPGSVLEIMQTHVRTLPDTATMSDAARIMIESRIGSLPVLREEMVMGIVTDTDLLRAVAGSPE